MDSSILELKEALGIITDLNQTATTGDAPGLSRANRYARSISGTLAGVNTSISEGWNTTSEFCTKIFNAIKEVCGQLYVEVNNFTDETYQEEQKAKKATEDANENAQSILDEIGLD